MGLIQTIKRETQYLGGILRMLKSIKNVDANGTNLIPDDLEKLCDKFGPNIAFLEDDKTMTYDEMETYANRVANWALSEGCVKGDTVCVFLRNRMEYVAIWFGLSKVGIVPALLNFQLTGCGRPTHEDVHLWHDRLAQSGQGYTCARAKLYARLCGGREDNAQGPHAYGASNVSRDGRTLRSRRRDFTWRRSHRAAKVLCVKVLG